LLGLIILTPACSRQSSLDDQAGEIAVDISFDPNPPVVGAGVIFLQVQDERSQPIEDLNIDVKGDMTHAGMTPVFGDSVHEGDGLYIVPFEWTMAGDWIIQVNAELPDGILLDRSFDVRVASE
jgi:hypothetical protein